MTDIAAKAGVSQSTVSFVLNGRDTSVRISQKTRQRVLEAAEELGYRSNHLARAIRTGNTQTLGFIGGDLCQEHVGRMLDGALEEAEKAGFTLRILPHRDSQSGDEQIIRRASELRLTGLAALHLPLSMLEPLRAETRQCNYAMVLLDTPEPLDGVAQVGSDDERGVRLAVEHLVQLGHERIALITGEPISMVSLVRERAFRQTMRGFGLEVQESLVAHGDFRFQEANLQAAHNLLNLPQSQRPTAIFCSGDLIACVAIQVASALGLQVPRDLSVVGFGDFRLARLIVPTLTTISQPFRAMGRRAVQRLIEQALEKNEPSAQPSGQPDVELLPVELIERSSTGRFGCDSASNSECDSAIDSASLLSSRDNFQFAPDTALAPLFPHRLGDSK